MPSRLRPRESAMVCRATRRTRSPEAEACDRRPLHALACTKTLATSRETIHRIHEKRVARDRPTPPTKPGPHGTSLSARGVSRRGRRSSETQGLALPRAPSLSLSVRAHRTPAAPFREARRRTASRPCGAASLSLARRALVGAAAVLNPPPAARPVQATRAPPSVWTLLRTPGPTPPGGAACGTWAENPPWRVRPLGASAPWQARHRASAAGGVYLASSHARARALQVPRCRGATETSRPW